MLRKQERFHAVEQTYPVKKGQYGDFHGFAASAMENHGWLSYRKMALAARSLKKVYSILIACMTNRKGRRDQSPIQILKT
jgi:hypothetical protein